MMNRFDSNGFQLKTVHHRKGWHCWSCGKEYDNEIPHHSWRTTISNGNYQAWQAWVSGCPDCFTAWVNRMELITYSLLEYIQEYNTTEGVASYVSQHLETIGDEE